MSGTPGGGGGGGGTQSLAFRVMRLCRPSFHVDAPLLVDPADLVVGEDAFEDPSAAARLPSLIRSQFDPIDSSDIAYRSRFLLRHPSDAVGQSGLLLLPQSFGSIYLGETFCSYISVNNSSNFEVREVIIKAEIHSDRQRIVLLDTTKTPVETIRSGGRYDFILEHDVKELGAHTLVCTAWYNDGDGEHKNLQQYFKFFVANPLSVKTKVRVVKETTYLEACLENHTKSNLYVDQVEFEPAPNLSAKMLKADEPQSNHDALSRELFKQPILIRSSGGICAFLYQLTSSSQTPAQSNILGKLQISWRTNLGEPGRLQTQQIIGTPIVQKEIELRVQEVPSVISVNRPFPVHLNLSNQTDRELGPFEIWLSQNDSLDEKSVMINGLQTMELPKLEALKNTDVHLNLIATKLGVQRIRGVTVFDKSEKKTYDPLPDLEAPDMLINILVPSTVGPSAKVFTFLQRLCQRFQQRDNVSILVCRRYIDDFGPVLEIVHHQVLSSWQ